MKFIYNGQELESGAPSGIPTKAISYADYQALSEDEKNEEILYLVEDAPVHEVFPQGMTIYSEEETVIGTYNGKPVYRRFLKGLQAPSAINTRSEYPSYGKEALHAGTVLALRGVATNSTGATEALAVLGYRASDDAFNCFILDWQDQKLIISNINRGGASSVWLSASVDVLLEYTKTTDASGSIEVLPTNYVQDYDTEDGWHVRKYSDGYVEMSLKIPIENLVTKPATGWIGSFCAPFFGPFTYPVPLTEYISSSVSAVDFGGGTQAICMGSDNDPKLSTSKYSVWSPIAAGEILGSSVLSFHVTGRWK